MVEEGPGNFLVIYEDGPGIFTMGRVEFLNGLIEAPILSSHGELIISCHPFSLQSWGKGYFMFKSVFLLVLLTSGLVWSQVADAMISGRVYDERGLPLANVKMTMRNLDTGRTWSVLTGEEGKYMASRLPHGGYRVEASLESFDTAIQSASLDIRNEARLDFMLRAAKNTHQESPTQYRGVQQSPATQFASTGRQAERFAVQLASYRTRPRAEGLRAMLEDVGYGAYVVVSNVPPSGRYYRVRVGPFDTREEAREIALNMQSRLSDLLPDFWIVSDR